MENPGVSTEEKGTQDARSTALRGPYVCGIGGDALHAVDLDRIVVDRDRIVQVAEQLAGAGPLPQVGAECGAAVYIARKWGEFRRGNEHLTTHQVCSRCAWVVALDQDCADEELAALTPTVAEESAYVRLLPDPTLLLRVCRAILTARQAEDGYDADSPRWAQLLGHVTAHRPVVLVPHDCAGGDCDHDDPAECLAVGVALACQACSVQAGSWAGEWQGQYELTVPAPCSVLSAMATAFGVEPTTHPTPGAVVRVTEETP
jgi:hypothetical protein